MTRITPFFFAIASLAAFRITRFITSDTFPFQSFRDRLEQRWKDTIYVDGLTCPFCMGAWVSFALIGGLAQIISIPLPGLYALATSTVVGIIAKVVD